MVKTRRDTLVQWTQYLVFRVSTEPLSEYRKVAALQLGVGSSRAKNVNPGYKLSDPPQWSCAMG